MMRKNIVIGFIIVLAVFLVISLRFTYIQIFKAESLQKEVVEQRVKKIKELPDRGNIVDVNGKTLAMSLNVKDIAVYPNIITKEETRINLSKYLSEELDLKYEDVFKLISQKDKAGKRLQWVRIAKRVDPETANEIKKSKYTQLIEISGSPKRYYPNGNLASSILGFVNHESLPGGGLELSLNHYLAGVSGYKIAEFDHMNKEIPIGLQTISKPIAGQQVQLTIDSYIQYTLEKTLENAVKELKPKGIHALVMEPATGKILGMASYPDFDPNTYEEFDPKHLNTNSASYVFEPGSIFKPVYLGMALESGEITNESRFYDGGTISVNGVTLKNWDSTGIGSASIEDIIVASSNVGMIKVSQELSSKQIVDGLKRSGYGSRTGIELPNEEVGLFPTPKQLDDDPLMKATIAFGQGISVTPLQMVTSFSELINGGYAVKPTLIEKVIDEKNKPQYQWEMSKGEKIYSDETVKIMKEALKANMVRGSGKDLQIEGYDGGGKTGSAWKVENGRYKDGAIIGTFMGFLPYDNPKYVMLAVVDEPTGVEFGSQSGGPIFKAAMTEIMRYKNEERTILKDGEKQKSEEVKIKNYKMEYYEDATNDIKAIFKNKVSVEKEGNGKIVISQRYRYVNGKLKVFLKTTNMINKDNTVIPNFVGKTKEDIINILEDENLKVEIMGEGKSTYQSIEPGIYTKKLDTLKIWFK
jgi:stage V sporulation protein D (sporulation-specific penicillin-binding protein)